MIYDKYAEIILNNNILDLDFIEEFSKHFATKENLDYNGIEIFDFEKEKQECLEAHRRNTNSNHDINYNDSFLKYDSELNMVKVDYDVLKNFFIKYFQKGDLDQKTVININNYILQSLTHELIHMKQENMKKNDNLLSKLYTFSGNLINDIEVYKVYHDIINVEYNANTEALIEIIKVCNELETRIDGLKFKNHVSMLKNQLLFGYNFENIHNLSPLEKTLRRLKMEDKIADLKQYREYQLMKEYDRLMNGLPVNNRIKQKVLNMDKKGEIDVLTYFKK